MRQHTRWAIWNRCKLFFRQGYQSPNVMRVACGPSPPVSPSRPAMLPLDHAAAQVPNGESPSHISPNNWTGRLTGEPIIGQSLRCLHFPLVLTGQDVLVGETVVVNRFSIELARSRLRGSEQRHPWDSRLIAIWDRCEKDCLLPLPLSR